MEDQGNPNRIVDEVGEGDLDVWDPMKEDFKNVHLNSYNRGPGAQLPMQENRICNSETNWRMTKPCKIFVDDIPLEMTEEALKKLFSQSGHVLFVKKMLRKHGSLRSTYGFVTFLKMNEAMNAVRQFNLFQIGSSTLRVSFVSRESDMNKLHADTLLLNGEVMRASNASSCAERNLVKDYNARVESKPAELKIAAETPAVRTVTRILLNDLGVQFVAHGHLIQCMVTEWQNPGSFYVQQVTVETANGLKELLTLCQAPDIVGSPPAWPGCNPRRGDVYTARFSKDGVWYRVVASEVDLIRGCIHAYFLDYGSWEEVAFKNVRPPLEEFIKHPPYAMHCKLAGVRPCAGEWDGCALPLKALLLNQLCGVRVEGCDQASKTYMVDVSLPSTGRFLRETLLEKGICIAESNASYVAELTTSCVAESNTSCTAAPAVLLPATSTNTVNGIGQSQHAGPAADTQAAGEVKKASAVAAEVCAGAALGRDMAKYFPNKGESFKAVVGDLVNPGLFFCQRIDFAEELARVMAALTCLAADPAPPRVSPRVGQAVSAQYSGDHVWYRALIMDIENEESVKVCYVDFGNCESLQVSRLRAIPPELLKLPPQGLRCSLSGVGPLNDAWSAEATGLLSRLVKDEILNAHVVSHDTRTATLLVKLSPVDTPTFDLSELLVLYRVAKPVSPTSGEVLQPPSVAPSAGSPTYTDSVELPVGTQVPVMVTEVRNPGHFYCFRFINNEIQALKEMLAEVAAYCKRTEPKLDFLPKPGLLCCARYSYDGTWYRARVLALNGGLVHVEFLDYGNSEEVCVDDLRPLDGDSRLLQWPLMAFRCSLAGVRPVNSASWSPESTEALLKFVSNRPLCVTVMGPRIGDTVPVQLQDDTLVQQEDAMETTPGTCVSASHQLVFMGLAEPCDVQEDRESPVQMPGVQWESDFNISTSSDESIRTPDDQLPGVMATPALDERDLRGAADSAAVAESFVIQPGQLVLHREVLSGILAEVTEAVKMLELLSETKKNLERVGKIIQKALDERQ